MRRFLKNKLSVIGMVVIIIFILIAIFADQLAPYDYAAQDLTSMYLSPCAEHPLGTDNLGRDMLSRIIYGTRISLLIGFSSVGISLLIGTLLGCLAGFYGGKVDTLIMRFMDVMISIPSILLTLCIVAILGSNVRNLMIALVIGQIPGFTRIIRSVILNLKGWDYSEAAKSYGASNAQIILRHILPNAMGPIIVQATMSVSNSIIAAASLSFIGLGCQPPTPEWGIMLSEAKDQMRKYAYLAIFPGASIAITALCFNLMGDGIRDALDPRLKD